MSSLIRRPIIVGLALVVILALIPASPAHAATATFSGALAAGDPQFRLTNCTNAVLGPGYYYDTYPFTVDADGSYTMEMTAAALSAAPDDTWILLYQTAFDPAAPLTNCLAADDDSGVGRLSLITRNLTAGTQYILVVTSFFASATGTYSGQITGPGNITGPGLITLPTPPPPPTGIPATPGPTATPVITWFPGYQDGRINWREAYSPVALYAQDYGSGRFGLHIYNVGAGGPEPWLIVTPDMIPPVLEAPAQNSFTVLTPDGLPWVYSAATGWLQVIPTTGLASQNASTIETPDGLQWVYSAASGWALMDSLPEQHTLIAQTPDGYIRVYRLANGWFQVRAGPNAEGKISIIVFDRLCLGNNCATYTLSEIDPQ